MLYEWLCGFCEVLTPWHIGVIEKTLHGIWVSDSEVKHTFRRLET